MAPFRCREAGNGGGYTPPLRAQKRKVGVRQGKVWDEAGNGFLHKARPSGVAALRMTGRRRDGEPLHRCAVPLPYGLRR